MNTATTATTTVQATELNEALQALASAVARATQWRISHLPQEVGNGHLDKSIIRTEAMQQTKRVLAAAHGLQSYFEKSQEFCRDNRAGAPEEILQLERVNASGCTIALHLLDEAKTSLRLTTVGEPDDGCLEELEGVLDSMRRLEKDFWLSLNETKPFMLRHFPHVWSNWSRYETAVPVVLAAGALTAALCGVFSLGPVWVGFLAGSLGTAILTAVAYSVTV